MTQRLSLDARWHASARRPDRRVSLCRDVRVTRAAPDRGHVLDWYGRQPVSRLVREHLTLARHRMPSTRAGRGSNANGAQRPRRGRAPPRATFSTGLDDDRLAIWLESRSGAKGGINERHLDYERALRLILQRLAALDAVLVDAVVDSSRSGQMLHAEKVLDPRRGLAERMLAPIDLPEQHGHTRVHELLHRATRGRYQQSIWLMLYSGPYRQSNVQVRPEMPDFLDEIVRERSAGNPEFVRLVDAAARRRAVVRRAGGSTGIGARTLPRPPIGARTSTSQRWWRGWCAGEVSADRLSTISGTRRQSDSRSTCSS